MLGTIAVVAEVVVTDRWHRRVRRVTGVLIAPELVALMGYTAERYGERGIPGDSCAPSRYC